jgi:hypothetical protein
MLKSVTCSALGNPDSAWTFHWELTAMRLLHAVRFPRPGDSFVPRVCHCVLACTNSFGVLASSCSLASTKCA